MNGLLRWSFFKKGRLDISKFLIYKVVVLASFIMILVGNIIFAVFLLLQRDKSLILLLLYLDHWVRVLQINLEWFLIFYFIGILWLV